MHRILRTAAGATLVAALAGTAVLGPVVSSASASASTAAPHALPVAPHIVGGTRAPSTPWEVQLRFTQDGGVYGCTGEQLGMSWVLTARHCVDGIDTMAVYQSNSTSRRGPARAADRWYRAPRGDIALVHLARPAALPRYASLRLSFRARSAGSATIMGYGLRADRGRPSGLYRATVELDGRGSDAYHGRAQHVRGTTGAANHGDSGGALVLDSQVVAICSTGDSADPGSNRHAGASYAILGQSRSWLESTAGVRA